MKRFLLLALLLLVPTVGWAQGNTNTLPPACLTTNITTCVPQVEGTIVRMTDGASATDCATGGGSTVAVCQYDGSSWLSSTTVTQTWIGENGETITNGTDGTFTFTRDETGDITLLAVDDTGPASLLLDATGAGNITIGTSDVNSISLTATGTLTLGHNVANEINLQSDAGVVNVDGDVTINQLTANGNEDDINQFIGVPKMSGFVLGSSIANGTTSTTKVDFGDDETPAGEWVATANVTDSDDTAISRKGGASLKLVFGASLADTNGIDNALGSGDQDWQADGSFGMWARCSKITVLGTFDLQTVDATATNLTQVPAITVADQWQWIEVDVDDVADNALDVITDIGIHVDATGATLMASETCHFDYMWQWDATDEEALSLDVLEDGVIAVYSLVTATGGDRTPVLEVEGTDYIIHYEASTAFLVPVTDLSNDSLWGMAALE